MKKALFLRSFDEHKGADVFGYATAELPSWYVGKGAHFHNFVDDEIQCMYSDNDLLITFELK